MAKKRYTSKVYRIVNYSAIEKETDRAYKIQWGNKSHWIPKTQCVIYKVKKVIEISDWFFMKNDLHIITKDFNCD